MRRVEIKYGQNTTRYRSRVSVSCECVEAEGGAPDVGWTETVLKEEMGGFKAGSGALIGGLPIERIRSVQVNK